MIYILQGLLQLLHNYLKAVKCYWSKEKKQGDQLGGYYNNPKKNSNQAKDGNDRCEKQVRFGYILQVEALPDI